jgi:hypothetical protein
MLIVSQSVPSPKVHQTWTEPPELHPNWTAAPPDPIVIPIPPTPVKFPQVPWGIIIAIQVIQFVTTLLLLIKIR